MLLRLSYRKKPRMKLFGVHMGLYDIDTTIDLLALEKDPF